MVRVLSRLACGVGLVALGAHAAERAQVTSRSVDVLAGDDAIVEVRLPAVIEGEALAGPQDVRLGRVDVATGLPLKRVADVHGCDTSWEARLEGRGVGADEVVTFFLAGELPIAPYVPMVRPQGSNADWRAVGEPFWVVTHPVARVTPCQASMLSLDHQPVLTAARERTFRATVRLVTDDGRVGQGVVINPWGHVLTASALVSGARTVHVGFAPGAIGEGSAAARVDYEEVSFALPPEARQEHGTAFPEVSAAGHRLTILVPKVRDGSRGFVGTFATLADRPRQGVNPVLRFQHRGSLSTRSYATGDTTRLVPRTAIGAVVPSLEAAAGVRLVVDGPVGKQDQGAPVFDHAGLVWGILLDGEEAAWATHAVDRYVQWYHAGLIGPIAGRTVGGVR